jgi:hypothetical protein
MQNTHGEITKPVEIWAVRQRDKYRMSAEMKFYENSKMQNTHGKITKPVEIWAVRQRDKYRITSAVMKLYEENSKIHVARLENK